MEERREEASGEVREVEDEREKKRGAMRGMRAMNMGGGGVGKDKDVVRRSEPWA